MSDPRAPTTFRTSQFELAESPAGRLASFEADAALARALARAAEPTARAAAAGEDFEALVELSDGSAVRVLLEGAGPIARSWSAQGAECFLCAFHASLPRGAAAFELRWD